MAVTGAGDDEPQTSTQTRTEFMQYARKDEETGEYFMGEKEFVDAIAPEGEDYVSPLVLPVPAFVLPCTALSPCIGRGGQSEDVMCQRDTL